MKKNKYKIHFALLLILLGSIQLNAQKIAEDLMKVRQTYLNPAYITMNVEVMVYESAADTKGSLYSKGIMYESGNRYYSDFDDMETLINNEVSISVDHLEKSISYMEGVKPDKRAASFSTGINIDTLLTENDSVKYMGEINGMRQYDFYDNDSYITKTEIYIDTFTWTVKKIVYFYNTNNPDDDVDVYKLVVNYTRVSLESFKNKEASLFAESRFITKVKDGKVKPSSAYSGYEVEVIISDKIKKKDFN